MFVHTHDWILCDEWKFFPFNSLPTCYVVNLYSGGKLAFNEHIYAYSWLDIVSWVKILSFYLLYPLSVLWTGAPLVGKLALNEHVCAYSWLDFVSWVKIVSFYLDSLPTCCVVNWYSGGKLPLNEHVVRIHGWFCVMSENSFLFHLLCCELVLRR